MMIQTLFNKFLFSLAAITLGASSLRAQVLEPQLLTDPGFNSGSQPLVGWGSPDLDRWVVETAVLLDAPEGPVSPFEGDGMLRMNWGFGSVTQVLQLVDVSAYSGLIDSPANAVTASAEAWLTATIAGVSGSAVRVTARDVNRDSLGGVSSGYTSNATPSEWELAETSMVLPPLTRFVELQFTFSNASFSLGDRVYVDAAVLELAVAQVYPESCFGDGGDQMGCTDCPCDNNVPVGEMTGCMNSTGIGARLNASGSSSIPVGDPDDLRFEMVGGVATGFAVLVSGDAVAPTNSMNPCFGSKSGVISSLLDGLRCCVGNTQRHGGRLVDINGEVGAGSGWGGASPPNPSIARQGGFVPGQTRCFQAFYRERPGVVCGTEVNTTQAIEVTFLP